MVLGVVVKVMILEFWGEREKMVKSKCKAEPIMSSEAQMH